MRKPRFLIDLADRLSEHVGFSFAFWLRTTFGLTKIRYVGSGGNDASHGLSWMVRKRTLNAAINSTKPGDRIVIGPGDTRKGKEIREA